MRRRSLPKRICSNQVSLPFGFQNRSETKLLIRFSGAHRSAKMSLARVVPGKRKLATLLQQSVRCYAGGQPGYWNHEWRPGPVPKTEEERRAAAKKYGLIPADYQTYPDDGTGFGDYPKIEPVSGEARDPYALWDQPELKRNYGEPLYVEADMIGEDRLNVNQRLRFSPMWHLYTFLGVMGVSFALFMFCEKYLRFIDVKIMPRHKPLDGKKHYSFELEEKK